MRFPLAILTLLFWVCLSSIGTQARAQAFTVEGKLTYSVFARGETKHSIQKSFILHRSGELWLIHTSDLAGIDATNRYNLFEETAFDGTNLMELEVRDTFAKNIQTIKSEAMPVLDDPKLITVLGEVAATSLPLRAPIGVNAVWLAFAATPYFDGVTNGRVRTLELIPDEFSELQEVQADWQKNSEFPYLLRSVNYHNDGRTVAWLPNGKKEIENWPSPYEHGYVDATFAASGFTNIAGLHLPTQFSYTSWWPDYTKSNKLVVASIVEGAVTQVRSGADIDSFYPKFVRRASVDDRRFEKDGVKNFNYIIEKDGEWRPVNHPKIQSYLKYWKQNYSKPTSMVPITNKP